MSIRWIIPFSRRKYFRTFKILTRNMSMQNSKPMIGVCQFTANADKESNFRVCENFIHEAKSEGACMIFLPECYDFIGNSQSHSSKLSEPVDGNIISRYSKLAKKLDVWLSLGGGHEKADKHDSKIFNSHLIINNDGDIVENYRKSHLFEVDIPGKVRLKETDFTMPGNFIHQPVDTPIGRLGLGICYDMRFPEFSMALTNMGAEILTYPSAFTVPTGKAHWEALLRARAIETQTYVIAAAQVGKHNEKRESYGHAMVVDPWGKVIASCGTETKIITAEIDLSLVKKIRQEMPVTNHRRIDMYPSIYAKKSPISNDSFLESEIYSFGDVKLPGNQLFHKTNYSMAFVNIKPVVPGHVLVSPIRTVKRLSGVTSDELSDLFNTVQKVQKIVEKHFNATSSTISIQDGEDAGQTVEHVHVHILPRHASDFKSNDEIYELLEKHDKGDVRLHRTLDEMANEAASLRPFFY